VFYFVVVVFVSWRNFASCFDVVQAARNCAIETPPCVRRKKGVVYVFSPMTTFCLGCVLVVVGPLWVLFVCTYQWKGLPQKQALEQAG
jgi:predicted small integral membrane protein